MDFSAKIIFKGDGQTAFRDPAAYYHNGTLHLFFTLAEKDANGVSYLYLAHSESRDLSSFSKARKLTEKNAALNYSSPGCVIERNGEFWLCFQSYPREKGEKYASSRARIFTSRTKDFRSFTPPELMRVKGNIPEEDMGRMIDPYLLADANDPGLVWCFYKQNGVSMSKTRDMKNWEFAGSAKAGENVCVLWNGNEYVMFHSPEDDGIGIKLSHDLVRWRDHGNTMFFDAKKYDWSKGRVTAGFVLDMTEQFGKYVMFYHASGPESESVYFDTNASIAMRSSEDILKWE